MMEIVGYIAALFMGIALGLIGGGGSILTVPILVYIFAIDTVLATAYSLFIVGITSFFGSLSHIRLGHIHWKTALVFGIPSMLSVYLTRLFIVPIIPDPIGIGASFAISKSMALLVLFALIMLVAAYSMIRKTKSKGEEDHGVKYNFPLIFVEGAVVGMLTGLVGAGGGFLIIPALVVLAKLPMKQAVGTSLVIIASKSLFGFVGDWQGLAYVDWNFLLRFSAVAVAGILLGVRLSKIIANEKLKPAFGWFVLIMGVYIIIKELTGLLL